MIGLGVTPEGINQNYIIYDLMLEMAWRPEPQILEAFVDHYIYRRYGDFDDNVSNAWQILKVFVKIVTHAILTNYFLFHRELFTISQVCRISEGNMQFHVPLPLT